MIGMSWDLVCGKHLEEEKSRGVLGESADNVFSENESDKHVVEFVAFCTFLFVILSPLLNLSWSSFIF